VNSTLTSHEMTSLGEIAEFRNGVNFVASQRGAGVPVVNVKDFQDRFQPDYSELEQLICSAVRPESLLHAGDILFVRSNGNKDLIGRSMYLVVEPPRPTTHSAFTIRMRILDPTVEPRYCAYLIRSGIVRQTLSAQGSGTNISNLNQNILSRLKIWLPPLDVQRRIVGILSAYDDLLEGNTRRIAILEEMVRRLFNEWITKRHFSTDGYGGVTESWREARLEELVEDIRDPVLPSQVLPDTPYVGLEHMPRRSTTLVSVGRADQVGSTKLRFRSGDILFGKIRPYFHKVVFAASSGVTSSDSIVMRPRCSKFATLALCLVSSDAFVAHAVQTSNGTKMPRANWNVLRKYPIVVPPDAMLARFSDIVGSSMELCSVFAKMNTILQKTRDLLLSQLLDGEIDILDLGGSAHCQTAAE
jgi:type I restriction enzyme, S subunit